MAKGVVWVVATDQNGFAEIAACAWTRQSVEVVTERSAWLKVEDHGCWLVVELETALEVGRDPTPAMAAVKHAKPVVCRRAAYWVYCREHSFLKLATEKDRED